MHTITFKHRHDMVLLTGQMAAALYFVVDRLEFEHLRMDGDRHLEWYIDQIYRIPPGESLGDFVTVMNIHVDGFDMTSVPHLQHILEHIIPDDPEIYIAPRDISFRFIQQTGDNNER